MEFLGDYRILKTLKEGLLGPIFLAEHRFIKKQYILKTLSTELSSDKDFLEVFQNKISQLAVLDHPNIIKIHNVSYSDGIYFLVTDSINERDGETFSLNRYLAAKKYELSSEESMSILEQVAAALDYAHQEKKEAHLALNPENIWIKRSNGKLHVFLVDFGISKFFPANILPNFSLNVLSLLRGAEEKKIPNKEMKQQLKLLTDTLVFLSPEQKKHSEGDCKSDIYSFGILAYYLMSGNFPEGLFPPLSELITDQKVNWNLLIRSCLVYSPLKRSSGLINLLEMIKPVTIPDQDLSMIHHTATVDAEVRTLDQDSLIENSLSILKASLDKSEEIQEVKENYEEINFTDKEPEFILVTAKSIDEGPMMQKKFISTRETSSSGSAILQPLSKNDQIEESSLITTDSYDANYAESLRSLLNKEPIVTPYAPITYNKSSIEPLKSEMLLIEAGEFFRGAENGSRDESPAHNVIINSFLLDVHPVTNEQYVRFLEYTGSEKDAFYNDLIRLRESRIQRRAGSLLIEPGYSKHPVVGVTWYGAHGYAKWINKRLPTEAEWEIAAKSTNKETIYPCVFPEKSWANFFSSDTTPVMSYPANELGLYDMAGNVYEWCQDWYGYNYYETSILEPDNPKGPAQGVYRVLRGGCWKSLREDLRCAHRHRNNPGTVNGAYGFRCAIDI
ncbi:bifunctional serine/threonine-protein kinase/formylglycine-generating enzyme family protein [Candidatus Clavichlamydia salmonicola]|uniref:bifunctional serine/threonine-protein kinase/formylglycine-generating enzyme family protein n=1 Tax=Candidatus Clavichlamydia salmonicola TaxID=469812 RepID=UPI001E4F196A